MDINCSRYFDSIGVSGYNKNTFLNHWDRNNYRWSCSCKKSVHIAVRCIYESNSFEECMRNVLSIYCDTDTICAIAGSIAEHIFGLPEYADEKLNYYLDAFLCSVVYS